MKRITIYLVAFLLVAGAFPLAAQSLTGSITGRITDEQGGLLPGVTVTLTGKLGTKTTQTDAAGNYRFVALDPGTYAVQVELAGFRPKRQENIVVSIGSQPAVNFALGLGGIEETIEVLGEAPVVDVASSKTDNTLSQEQLFNLPLRSTSAMELMDFAPGVNFGSAYGGDSDTANALMLDGVDTRDPEGGSAWTFFAFNLVDEVQVSGLGAPAEYGSFTGAVINTVTKSGGNSFSGLFEAYYTKDSLAGDNVPADAIAQNPALGEAAKTNKYLDLTGQLGGPIIQDKLFFFLSSTYFTQEQDPTGPRTIYEEFSPRFAAKISYQPGPNDNFSAILQSDNYYITGRAGVSALICTDELTNVEDSQGWNWGGTWRHIFGSKTFSEVKYAGWTGFYDLNPVVGPPDQVPGHYDAGTGLYSDSQGWIYYADRGRHQVNASISHYAEGWGKHDLKFGVEIERSRVRSRYGYGEGGLFYYDYAAYYPVGQYTAYTYGYDVEGKNQRESVYLQDSWKVSDRLTLNLGARLDFVRGRSPVLDQKIYDTKNLVPRLGFAYDIAGDGRSVLKGSYSQYYEGAFFWAWQQAVPGIDDFVLHFYDPEGTDLVGPLGNTFTEYSRNASPLYSVDPDIKHPRTDEFTLGFEKTLGKDVRLSVTGIWREDKNLQGAVIPDARWEPIEVQDDLNNQPITVYGWVNQEESETNKVYTNPDGYQYLDENGNVLGTARAWRKYKGLMLVLDKRFSNRWQGRVSYVLSKAEGTQDNDGFDSFGPSTLYESPSRSLINREGRLTNDRTHELKVMATYQVPKIEVGLNAYWRTISGRNYTPYQQYSSRQINGFSSSGRRVFLEPQGSRRRDTQNLLSLRLEKIFTIGDRKDRIAFFADIENLFNASPITGIQNRVPDTTVAGVDEPILFGAPTGLVEPRQITLGARWSF